MIGKTLGHYQITEKLGEGGMGVVYKAQDLHLDRFVALKILPPEKVADPERKRRFVQEAKAASALKHPNIITVHDIDQSDGTDYIAMEHVDGKTLDELIPRKGMRLSLALKYAIQIADALARAHGAGIIHRDLKPSNVMVDEHGLVKVLDFGLAKLAEAGPAGDDACTRTAEATTEKCIILGTVAYMSPEQAEGKHIDTRSDIFSFGALLYEMLTGQRAFRGETKASTLAAILKEEPKPISQVSEGMPRDAEKIVRRCLRKDPDHRFQTMADLRVALEELKEESDSGTLEAVRVPQPRWRWLWAVAAAAVLLSTAVLVWRLRVSSPPNDLRPVALTSDSGVERQPSFSPDGNKVAFVWNGEKEDNYDIYVKQISSAGSPLRLTASPSEESSPAWSPDDRWIAFTRVQQGKVAIMLIPPLGGHERVLTEMVGISGLSWTPDAKWLAFEAQESQKEPRGIWAISVETGERRRLTTFVTKLDAAQETALGDSRPSISPDGRQLAFARTTGSYVFELYVLWLTRDLRPDGEPRPVTSQRYATLQGIAWTNDSREIVYSAGGAAIQSLWRVPVSGQQTPNRIPYALPAATYPAIARTPPRLAYTWYVLSLNLWRLDTRTGERKMLIGSTYDSRFPQYSPDGSKIAFQSNRSGNVEVWTCNADGSGCTQLTSFNGPQCGTPRWSPDSRWLALDSRVDGQPEIYVIAADGGTPQRRTNHPASDIVPSWSSNGLWIYFSSDRSGQSELWKMPANGGEPVQVTQSGGLRSTESPDGRYIYYTKRSESGLFRMPVEGGDTVRVLPTGGIVGVTRRGVYFQTGRTIQFLDTASGTVSTLVTLDKPGGWVTVSQDDAYVVWAQTDRNTQDLMLVENFR